MRLKRPTKEQTANFNVTCYRVYVVLIPQIFLRVPHIYVYATAFTVVCLVPRRS